VFFLIGAGGHGWNPFQFVYYLAFPFAFVLDLLPIDARSHNIWLLSGLFLLAGLIQWTIIGYLGDILIRKRQVRRSSDEIRKIN